MEGGREVEGDCVVRKREERRNGRAGGRKRKKELREKARHCAGDFGDWELVEVVAGQESAVVCSCI